MSLWEQEKFINDLEINKAEEAELDRKVYSYILDEDYRTDQFEDLKASILHRAFRRVL